MPGLPMRSPLIFAIRVIAESGTLYTLATIAALCATFVSDSSSASESSGSQYPLVMTSAIVRPTLDKDFIDHLILVLLVVSCR